MTPLNWQTTSGTERAEAHGFEFHVRGSNGAMVCFLTWNAPDGNKEIRMWFGQDVDNEKVRCQSFADQVTAAIDAETVRLRGALDSAFQLIGNPDENANDRFERIGAMYYKDTLFLRPGKSDPFKDTSDPENVKRFEDWYDKKLIALWSKYETLSPATRTEERS